MHVEQNCRDKTQATSLTKSHVSGADYVEHVIMWFVQDTHLSFSFLTLSRWSSVMCSDGGLKWDMTTRNSSKPISWTFPSLFWWKFLRKKKGNSYIIFHSILLLFKNYCDCTFGRRRPLWSVSGWDCMIDLGSRWSDLSWQMKRGILRCVQVVSHMCRRKACSAGSQFKRKLLELTSL